MVAFFFFTCCLQQEDRTVPSGYRNILSAACVPPPSHTHITGEAAWCFAAGWRIFRLFLPAPRGQPAVERQITRAVPGIMKGIRGFGAKTAHSVT